jgi:hypothetical protein
MKFTDIFIRRPVLAGVVSLLIVVLGLRSLFSLPVNQYPKTQNAVVTDLHHLLRRRRRDGRRLHHAAARSAIAQARASTTCRRPAPAASRRSPRRCA